MIFPRLAEIESALSSQNQGHTTFQLAILRNVTLEGMEPYLRYASMLDGLGLQLHWGDYDNILQEASGLGSGAVNGNTQAVLVALWLVAFSEILTFTFASASAQQIADESARVRAYCASTLRSLREQTTAPILWISFEQPAWPSNGIADANSPPTGASQRAVIAELNSFVISELEKAGNAWLVDASLCLERVGSKDFYDWRYWHIARAPYGRNALAELAGEVHKHLRAETGRVRKCLILDCDNTLWGGIVGEDGVNGINIGAEYPGTAYREFQLEVLNLYHRGVILGLCSKNNYEDVIEVLRSRSDMVLREEHFAIMRINWQDKVTNLREIAAELNIGLESIVFTDDSDFEINLVREALPEVTTLHVPSARPYEYRDILLRCGWFDTHAVTDEDRSRSKMYRADAQRKHLATKITDIGAYLKSLEMQLIVAHVTDAELDRIAQLCQRTNQFNLTTRRYSHDELAAHMDSPESTLLLMRLSDRFGDYGIVGFCLAINSGNVSNLDTFLMSCRALGRSAETAFLALCARKLAEKGASVIAGVYRPTKKNGQVANFYQRHGFTTVTESEKEMTFSLQWVPDLISVPDIFNVDNNILNDLNQLA
jgi:FkbH-like protein